MKLSILKFVKVSSTVSLTTVINLKHSQHSSVKNVSQSYFYIILFELISFIYNISNDFLVCLPHLILKYINDYNILLKV